MVQGHDSSKKQPYTWQMAGYYQQAYLSDSDVHKSSR